MKYVKYLLSFALLFSILMHLDLYNETVSIKEDSITTEHRISTLESKLKDIPFTLNKEPR